MAVLSKETIRAQLKDQRIILVGGAGFIGHNLALELRTVGAEVMVLDNLGVNSLVDNAFYTEPNPVRLQLNRAFLLERFQLMNEAGVHLRNGDARQLGDLMRLFDEFQPTKVVHLAAIASAVDANKNPALMFDLQLIPLRHILELARNSQSQINQVMLLSSSTVYGDFETPVVDEFTRPKPKGIYANTKYMAERLMRTYRDQYNVGTTIIRPSALYGERCVSRRVSQAFIENALMGKPLLLEGGGDGRLDFTYIGDLVDGMVRAMAVHAGRPDSTTFNLTFGNARTIAELAAIVKDLVPSAILEDRPRAEHKPVRGTLSVERARNVLGFEPQWPLETGYRKYCEWYIDRWNRVKASMS